MSNLSLDLSFWLQLIRIPGLGPRRLWRLSQFFPNAEAILQASRTAWLQTGLNHDLWQSLQTHRAATRSQAEADLEWLARSEKHAILIWSDPRYPELLKQIADAPPVLYVKGDVTCLSKPQLALVGSRHASKGGVNQAYEFANALAEHGFVVTSGLALGIDAAAHQGALDISGGKTIGVLGTDIEHIYPSSHLALAEAVIENGALVSEFPLPTPPKANNFPKRNRIISGCSLGVIVIEAAALSGSLITAHAALEQGREVFAVPGSVQNPLAKGCHQLIKQGAKLVETLSDILEELSQFLPTPPKKTPVKLNLSPLPLKAVSPPLDLDPTEKIIWDMLKEDAAQSIDNIVERSTLPASQVTTALLALELKGCVYQNPLGYLRQAGLF